MIDGTRKQDLLKNAFITLNDLMKLAQFLTVVNANKSDGPKVTSQTDSV